MRGVYAGSEDILLKRWKGKENGCVAYTKRSERELSREIT